MRRERPKQAAQQSELARLAATHGLTELGGRPGLFEYIRTLWSRRSFLWVMSSSRAYSRNQNNHLGQLWNVLSPLALAAVYFVVFGILLGVDGGVDNYPAFLTIGIFIFLSFASTVTAGSNAILSNMSVVRALQFPRAILPMSVALSEMLTLLPAMGVMVVLVTISGEPISWSWLLLPVALALVLLFTSGVSMLAARIVVVARDLRNLIPVGIRLMRYVSGVFFLIPEYAGGVLGLIMAYQPVAIYLTLVRSIMLGQFDMDLTHWLIAAGWAIGLFVIGFLVFWRGEDEYGRD